VTEMAIQNVCEVLIFRPPTVCKSSIPGETVGGEEGEVPGSHLGRNAAYACPNRCGGNLVLSLYL
jgi:hypothetical protein